MAASPMWAQNQLRLAELLSALSLTTDLGAGMPFEKGLRTCVVASALATVLRLSLEDRRRAWETMLASGMEKAILFTEERLRFLKKANRNNRLSIDALLATGYEFLYGNEPDVITGVAETIDWYRQQRWIV